ERDARFENDIEKITETILKDLFRSRRSSEEIRKRYIDPINEALVNIFGADDGTYLKLIEIIPPLEGRVAQITFQKGMSEIHYNYLSAGEKEIFSLLVNLLSRKHLCQDSIYFLDEIDIHLNTQLQFKLIKEIVENWIPDSCQIWTASHSLGFIEFARQSENASIIDLDNYNFDYSHVLIPEPKENPDVYEIAVSKEFLPNLFKNQDIFFVENKDKDYYASASIANTIFVSENNRNNVFHKVRSSGFKGIVDRDFLSDEDISLILRHYPRWHILPYYSIESFLYHPDNLEEYYKQNGKSFNESDYIEEIRCEKNKVRAFIIPSLALKRTEYPYFCEPQYNGSPLQNRFKNKGENMDESGKIATYYESDEFEIFYKCFPMKSYCTQLAYRSSVPKSSLSKTVWFRNQVEILVDQRG
ncbi:MAG TPA: AAA family ATPase, partial [Candidatus Babeliaceae bacterium]|nr:AAA family ATPase [Candidatus Babeliaceae bacterium]